MERTRRIVDALGRRPLGSIGGALSKSRLQTVPARIPSAVPAARSILSSFVIIIILSLLSVICVPIGGFAATPPGTNIPNTASVVYTSGASSVPLLVTSNTVTVTTVAARTTAVLELLQYAPGSPGVPVAVTQYSTSGTTGGPFSPLAPPVTTRGTAIDLANPVPIAPATIYHMGEPVFIRLTDLDQNLDAGVRETVLVTISFAATGDVEVLRLTETGPNTGVFTGYIQTGPGPATSGNGILNVQAGSPVTAAYVDAADATDTEARAAMIDPYGIVFDSTTGQPVNGASVSLVDGTGAPAVVYGDDGVTVFPATVVTGGTVVAGGTTYTFPPGGFRFPYILPGNYRLVVTPPAGFRAPSVVPTAILQVLPGAPFAIADPGSRGELFIVNPGPVVHIDIPVDATGGGLYLTKTAGKDTAAIGDFVPYHLAVENTSTTALAPGVTVSDRLPAGFRYRKGSARRNGSVVADPPISPDGRTLSFSVGQLDPSAQADISYVAEVGAGATTGNAVNSAVATSLLGNSSNRAQATVLVTDDLFREKATIVGRVSVDGCGDTEKSEKGGLAGVRIFREDGSFVVTDKNGMYHFEAVEPGTHVVQLDVATLPARYEVLPCEENTRFAGSAFSQFVDVQGGTLWRADFHLGLRPKEVGEVSIELQTPVSKGEAEATEESIRARRDIIKYTIPIQVSAVPARNLRITILLPQGAEYQPGTTALDGKALADPEVTDGAVTIRIPSVPANWNGMVRFDATVPAAGALGPLPSQAVLTADTPESPGARTPLVDAALVRVEKDYEVTAPDIVLHPQFESGSAALSNKDKKDLDRLAERLKGKTIVRIGVTGHTDSRPISDQLKKLYPDNYVLSQARASSVGYYLARVLRLDPGQVTFAGKGPDDPVASNSTESGRSRNRRVEVRVTIMRTVVLTDIQAKEPSSGMKTVATLGLRPGEEWKQEKKTEQDPPAQGQTSYDAAWLAKAEPGYAWLWPPDIYHPAIPMTRVAIKHDPATTVTLLMNGEPVDGIYLDGTLKRQDNAVAVTTWNGINLAEGDNRLEAIVTDEAGHEVRRETRTVHYSGTPVAAVLDQERSRLVADGKTPPVIAVRLLDKDGHPAREGLIGEFSVDPPHMPNQSVEDLQRSPLTASSSTREKYHVGDDGVALIELAPTSHSGEAVLRIPLANGTQEIRVWLRAEKRDWILVGLAEGTVGYNVVTGNMETLASSGGDDNFYENDRVAFYAKGMIKGEWLLTLAYDSAKKTPDGRPSLYQTVDPNKYYMLYGDATDQRYDAASAKKIYVKLERGQFYALFGDYDTGLTVTELSRYSRNFTGFKSEYKGDRVDATVFAADTNQAFVKDEIPGDGTSGLYHLSRKNIVINSESVVIETRDRFHSEVIVSSQPLSRFLDYTIDYDAGTLFFKYPIFSRDQNFNPVYIVVRYESFDSSDLSYNYGGRGAVRFLDKRIEVGATHVHEGRVGGAGDLNGVDATVQLDENTKMRAEVAGTRTDELGATTDGSAYLAEVTHQSEKLNGKAYIREQGNGFGLGQQNGSETGTRKAGLDLLYHVTDHTSLGGSVFRQETFLTDSVRDSAEVQARYSEQRYDYFGGYRHVEDSFSSVPNQVSDQVFAGARYQLTDRLTARVQHDQTISSGANSADYPTRTTLGLDYQLTKDTVLFGAQELTRGTDRDTATTRVGMKTSPWTGMQMNSTVEQQATESGTRLFSTTGLRQTWQVNKQWTLDAGMDRSATIHQTATYLPNPNVPPASGGEDFTAFTAGAGYRAEKWSWNVRGETRTSASENKIGLFTGAYGEPMEGVGLAAAIQGFRTDNVNGSRTSDSDMRLGYAYRPVETRWIVLDRLDRLASEMRGGTADYNNWRLVNNIVANRTEPGTGQVSLQYGAKYVQETIDSTDYRGYTDLVGLEGRYDITRKVDLGLRVSRLHSWAIDQTQYGTSVSVGFTMAKNFWLSVGYNLAGFQDRDFSKADFTAEGPFVKLRMKFDQVSAGEAIKWFTGQ